MRIRPGRRERRDCLSTEIVPAADGRVNSNCCRCGERVSERVILLTGREAFGLRLRVRLARPLRHHGKPPFCRN